MTEHELIAQAREAIGVPPVSWRQQMRSDPVKFFAVVAAVLFALSLLLSQVNTFVQARQIGPELTRLRARGDCRAEINAAAAVAQGNTILALGDYVATEGALVESLAKVPRDPGGTQVLVEYLGQSAQRLGTARIRQADALERQSRLVELCASG